MNKQVENRKKYSFNFKIKVLFYILIILIIFFSIFRIYNDHTLQTKFNDIVRHYSNQYNYVLKNLEIIGLKELPKEEIEKYFSKYYENSIFLVPLNKISKNILKEKWVKSAVLKSNYRNKVTIIIEEHIPIGIYNENERYFLVDQYGNVIKETNENRNFLYISFSGKSSKKNMPKFFKKIPNSLLSEIKRADFIGERRWNIILKNKILLKLPEKQEKKAFDVFLAIYEKLNDKEINEINSIDLRILGRAIIKFI
tara:strand:+ start:1391 stop:2152 length:762 start_codon:yes stop_codon:yes gene_type:complete